MTDVLTPPVRAFLEEPHHAVMATVNRSGTPQLTAMWYALHPDEDVVLLNSSRGLLKVKNLGRDARMALCVEDGPRYVGQRLGGQRWELIKRSDRIGIRMRIHRVHARGL